MNIERLIERIKDEEGFSPVAFWDRKQWTWGYGTKAPGECARINSREAEVFLIDHIQQSIRDYKILFGKAGSEINEVRQECLVDMIFNLGYAGVKKFRQMVEDINDNDPNDWAEVAEHAKDSLWYKQVKARAERIYLELRTGRFVE
jgi:GH24 family phage-related lysozyme (muramidase)